MRNTPPGSNSNERARVLNTVVLQGRAVSGFNEVTPSLALSLQLTMLNAAEDCGCKTGTAVMAGALLVYVVVTGIAPWLTSQSIGLTWTRAALVGAGAAILGKMLGLLLAGLRLRRAIEQLEIIRKREHPQIAAMPERLYEAKASPATEGMERWL